jgi:hypothetical protein
MILLTHSEHWNSSDMEEIILQHFLFIDDSYVTSIKWSYPSFTVNLQVNEREEIVLFVA